MANLQHGRPQDELFMNKPQNQPDTPSVGPLRINKSPANSPPPSINSTPAPGAYRQPPYPTNYTAPTSPPPAGPLPNPHPSHFDPRRAYTPPTTHTPEPRHPSPGSAHSSTSPRPHFSAKDPNRPSVAGYAHAPHYQEPVQYQYRQDSLGGNPNQLKPLPESPGPEAPDKDHEYSRQWHSPQPSVTSAMASNGESSGAQQPHYYYPPPSGSSQELRIPNPVGVNRLASTSSVSTTKAARGSPPPPETPASEMPTGGIEARYAAAGIAGPNTLTSLQAHTLAAQQRQREAQAQSAAQQQQRSSSAQSQSSAGDGRQAYHSPTPSNSSTGRPPSALEQDMQRLQVSDEPPPAYSSVTQPMQGYPAEKRLPAHQRAQLSISTGPSNAVPIANTQPAADVTARPQAQAQTHPAFANDPTQAEPVIHQPTAQSAPSVASTVQQQQPMPTPSPATSRNSPPPLPEGWIAHLDPNSGQYYYIHLPTQSTQWEFPKGPTPLNLNDHPPLSPTGTILSNPFSSPTATTFGGKAGLASPGLMPHRDSVMTSMSGISSPTAAGFHVPPPEAGVETYRVAPTNGVYFGPYLRYTNMDVENGIWYGSILLVTDAQFPPTIHIHQSVDLSPNPRQLKPHHIYTRQKWLFYRYDIDLRMEDDHEAKWTYAITSHLGCTRYEFLVAGRHEQSWRFIAHSGNDFALNVNVNERQKVGGVGYMWKDIMAKHVEVGGFHAQLGMGNQIYADRIWKEIPSLRQWTATSGKENRKTAPWTAQHEEEVTHAYFHIYTSHFDQPFLREAFAQIPHILALDDHDIFDGFGSYPEHMQFSNMFKNIGRIGIEMYLLFQHHTTLEILGHVTNDLDLFTITGTGWHFVKYLGPSMVVVGPDCRSERNPYQVMAGPTYQGLFPKIAVLPPCVQHCILMIPVPVVYPRLEAAEQFAQTMATGKKAVTGTFNALGKVTAGVAGIVGAKGVVGEGFNQVKKAVGKSGLMSNVLSPFGEIDILDELRDQWTHESKDLERTYLIRTLQGIAAQKSLRMTFFSGAANCCGAGLLSDPAVPQPALSSKAMYQIISSAVVNCPPSQYVLRMLHPRGGGGNSGHSGAGRPLYVPPNGVRSRADMPPSDTKEDMLEVFAQDVTGQARDMRRLMGRRNYVAVVAFDPEAVSEAFGQSTVAGSIKDGAGAGRMSLAIDFFVQSEPQFAGQAATVKYGPLTVPSVVPGH